MLCPAASDAALCEEYVRGYWGDITAAMYPKFLDPKDVCKKLGACTKDIRTFLATPTCDECRGSITRVAEVISSPEQDAEIVAFLQSDWCPGTEDVEACKQGVADLIPSAMPILGEVLVERMPNTAASFLLTESAASWIRTDLELNHRIIAHQPSYH